MSPSDKANERGISLEPLITELQKVCDQIRDLPEDERTAEVVEGLNYFQDVLDEVERRWHIPKGARQYFYVHLG